MATPHISAKKGEIAKALLLPGDPKRAEFIAENYLSETALISEVRGIKGYTGMYKKRRVSVIGSGMGIPSVSIYANELYAEYGVETIIRIGTCGTAKSGVRIGDVLLALGCSTDSGINRLTFVGASFCPVADYKLLRQARDIAAKRGTPVTVGNILSTDMFYAMEQVDADRLWWKYGVLGVEMEGAGLYTAALKHGRRALMLCTVSDFILTREGMSPLEREKSLTEMIEIGLETIWQQEES